MAGMRNFDGYGNLAGNPSVMQEVGEGGGGGGIALKADTARQGDS
jgi:hypothetical protein